MVIKKKKKIMDQSSSLWSANISTSGDLPYGITCKFFVLGSDSNLKLQGKFKINFIPMTVSIILMPLVLTGGSGKIGMAQTPLLMELIFHVNILFIIIHK